MKLLTAYISKYRNPQNTYKVLAQIEINEPLTDDELQDLDLAFNKFLDSYVNEFNRKEKKCIG